MAAKHGLSERTIRRFEYEHEHDIRQSPLGRRPLRGHSGIEVAKKLIRLPKYKRKWSVRVLAQELHINKSTLHELLPAARVYVDNPSSCEVKSSVTDADFDKMALEDIDSATESIWVIMFALSSICYTQKLIDKRKTFPDMEIKVIIDLKWAKENKSGAAAVRQLIENGIDVYHLRKKSKRNHRKLLICDGLFATGGTMNYTKAGKEDNDEDLFYMFGQPVEKSKETFLVQLAKSKRTKLSHLEQRGGARGSN